MARFRKSSIIRDNILGFLCGVLTVVAIVAVLRFFFGRSSGEEASSAPEAMGDAYICSGCGKEYIGQFPYTSPWAGYPAELDPIQVVDIGRETSYNGSIDGATPVEMHQRVTGNLSSRDDVDFYSFTVDVLSSVNFGFSFDGSSRGYAYLWDAAIYGTDGATTLNAGSVQIEDGEEVTFSVSDLEPGTYYLKISVASGGNPFLNGYSDADYHISFTPRCAEHVSLTYALAAAPTCSQAGELISMCGTCGDMASSELEPLDHIWSKWKKVSGISFSSPLGESSRTCALCGETETEALLPHLLDRAPKTDPDAVTVTESWAEFGPAPCASEGFVETVCSVCGNVEVESKEAPGHTYGEWAVSRAATCSAEGQRSRSCTTCGHMETEPLAVIPHVYGETVRVSGSILDAPIVSRKTCTECGYVNTVESNWSRWILPAIVLLGAAAAVFAAILALRAIRKLHRKTRKKRQEKTFLCPYCFMTSKIRDVQIKYANGAVCPRCQKHLPESTLKGDDMIISVVGSRDTGKTHFIAVIINELIGRIAPAFGGSFEGFGDTTDRCTKLYRDKLYGEKPTRLEGTERNVKGENLPLIYTLKLREKGRLGRGEKVRLFTLVFFDSAGEDLQESWEDTRRLNPYICKSKGIIFLLDPLKIPAVRSQLDEREVKRASAGDWYRPDDILVRISNLIRKDKDLSGSDKIEVPVSVVFSKFDVIEPIIPRGCTILEPSPHCGEGAFDLSDGQNADAEVQGLLQTWGAESFLRQLEINYKNYACFTVSALGIHNNPGGDGKISRPRPHRIEDPLLWLLMKQKVIRARKRQKQTRKE